MKRTIYYFTAICVSVLCACNNSDRQQNATNDTANTMGKTKDIADADTANTNFFKNAGYGGLKEVEFSNRILQSTKDNQIKAFAAMLVKDHQAVNAKLKILAKNKGFEVPSVLPANELKLFTDQLSALKQEGKDKFYIKLILTEHQKAIDIFSLASRTEDSQISNFAKVVLPSLRLHYAQAQKIDSLFTTPQNKQGDDPLHLSDDQKH